MKVKECMTNRPEIINESASIYEAAQLMNKSNCGFLPVISNEILFGVITDRDIVTRVVAANKDITKTLVRDAMSPNVFYSMENEDVATAEALMADKGVLRVPVVNAHQELVGVVSMGDIARLEQTFDEVGRTMSKIAKKRNESTTQKYSS